MIFLIAGGWLAGTRCVPENTTQTQTGALTHHNSRLAWSSARCSSHTTGVVTKKTPVVAVFHNNYGQTYYKLV